MARQSSTLRQRSNTCEAPTATRSGGRDRAGGNRIRVSTIATDGVMPDTTLPQLDLNNIEAICDFIIERM